jgi:hypothetical protein
MTSDVLPLEIVPRRRDFPIRPFAILTAQCCKKLLSKVDP